MPPSAESDSTSGCEGADFADFPAGAIALIQRGTCLFQTKVRKAKYAGAVAVIMFNEGQEGRLDLFGGAMEGGEDVAIPAIATTFAVGQQLYESAQAGETVVRVSTDVYEGPQTIHNVLATYPGRSGKRWVMGAHLDSVPAGPGINDNGSGVAMLLEAARHVSRAQPDLDHGVEFAFWGAEEIGLIGSLHYVRELSEEEIPSVVGNLNFDMIGSPNPGRFVYDGDQSMYQTWIVPPAGSDVIEQVFNHYFDTHDMPYAPTAFDGRSDYYGFVEAGIPSGGLFTGAEETISLRESELFDVEEGAIFDACYHQYCDDFGNVDFQMLTELSQTSIHAMMTLVAHPFFAEIERDDSVSSESESESESEARGRVELPKRVEHACHGVRRLIR
jgi:Zn-dependent M28 family amino/carboxypeptidase